MKILYRICIVPFLTVMLFTCFLNCANTGDVNAVGEDFKITAGAYEFDGNLSKVIRGHPSQGLEFSTYLTNNEFRDMRRAGAVSVLIVHDLKANKFGIRPIFPGTKKNSSSSLRSLIITSHENVIEVRHLSKLSNKEIWVIAFEPYKMSEKTRKLSVSDEIMMVNRRGSFSTYMITEPASKDVLIKTQ